MKGFRVNIKKKNKTTYVKRYPNKMLRYPVAASLHLIQAFFSKQGIIIGQDDVL